MEIQAVFIIGPCVMQDMKAVCMGPKRPPSKQPGPGEADAHRL